MEKIFNTNFKLGILGGGQLGKMLCEAASSFHINTHVLDKDPSFPAAHICHHFTIGDFKNYDHVLNFGKDKDVITIEIESVNIEAIKELEKRGIKVYPQSKVLDIIIDKGHQKTYFIQNKLPTTEFQTFKDTASIISSLNHGKIQIPFVQKLRKDGYDGRGVKIIKNEDDLAYLLKGPCLIEKLVDIDKEIGVIVARNPSGEVVVYDPVEMVFDSDANLVDYLLAPAMITKQQTKQIKSMAKTIIHNMDMVGILAIELFLDKNGNLLINEMAPRTHNSGHHTIEACACSQFEQHLRSILDLPLGNIDLRSNAIMINLLGANDHIGEAKYEGIDHILKTKEAHLHIYGKKMTKPQRKMGHLTVLGDNIEELLSINDNLKSQFSIVSGSDDR